MMTGVIPESVNRRLRAVDGTDDEDQGLAVAGGQADADDEETYPAGTDSEDDETEEQGTE